MDFYTNISNFKNKIMIVGYQNGRRYKDVVHYRPTMFIPTHEHSKYKSIDGKNLQPKDFPSIYEARQFKRQYDGTIPVYGFDQFQYNYIYENFRNCKHDPSLLKVAVLDIEVATEDGYPDIQKANKEITAITVLYKDITFCFAMVDFKTEDPKIKYIKCKDEFELLTKTITLLSSDRFRPDVITGWNIEQFDIPYLIHRITNLLGEDFAKKLSPFEIIEQRQFMAFNKMQTVYSISGVNILDYYQLYKKFTYHQQESYKLDHICEVELGEKKIDYSQYGSLNRLYKENPQLYIEYNIKDCVLVMKLDDKMKLLNLVYTFAYDSGLNYIDALTSVRSWDVIISNYLRDQNIIVPPKKAAFSNIAGSRPVGAHVKDPISGLHEWIVSFDLASLYPHLIISYNISPDTFIGELPNNITIDQLLNDKFDLSTLLHENKVDATNFTVAASGCMFSKDKQGFLPFLMEDLFNKRKSLKDEMIEKQKELYRINEELNRREN